MVISELLRDLDRSRAYSAELATHAYPLAELITEAMNSGDLRSADPIVATNQLGWSRTPISGLFFYWEKKTDGVMEERVTMFLSYYQPEDWL